MSIADDGIGIDPCLQEGSTSMGLFGMKERARQCNGALEFEANIPSGTILKVFLPDDNKKDFEISDVNNAVADGI
jgi:signal transduction histidine kinase